MLAHDVCTFARQGEHVRLPACPQCGDMLLAPIVSQHVSPRLVHNHWACESCGHTFRKSHEFGADDLPDFVIA